ncbi:hypothetical protein BGZ68_010534 [Mortierella alpina]|nr:hypothetical protein BGZ68_010534 [Mortierella alpina]
MDHSGNHNVAAVPYVRLDMSGLDVRKKKEPTRVFFEQGQNGQLEATDEPTGPISIKSSNDFQVSLKECTVDPGWYWAVFCVSLKETGVDKLKSITFDVKNENMSCGIVYTKDYTCKTAIQRDEIDLLPTTTFARLRLHRQIEVRPNTPLFVSIKVETASGCEEVVVPFDLHYFELAYHDIRSEDHILWGEGKPDQFIRMGDDVVRETRPIAIEAYDFSPTGMLAVTAYFTRASDTQVPACTPIPTHDRSQTSESLYDLDQDHSHISSSIYIDSVAHVDVWDLSVPSGQVVSDDPQAITTPVRSLSFPVRMLRKPPGDFEEQPPDYPPEPPLPTINISSTGFHIIMADPPVAYDYERVSETCQSIQKFYGYGAFHHSDQIDPKAENERYFNFHGFNNFDVYSTDGDWKQLYSLSFGISEVLHGKEMFYLYQSLRGRYFAWTADVGKVSIWDFETGKVVTTILVPKDRRGVCAALSEDGSMVAITVNGRIQLYDVASGIKLGSHKAQWKEDDVSEIIFKQDYFMALDAEQSTSGKKNIDAYSIFRVRDMKVVKTHFVPWEYRAELGSTVNLMFSFKQGAILNIKRLGNILCPTEDNGCTPDVSCELRSTELDLFHNTWSNSNQPSTETSFFAGPDHSPSRPRSIMRLLITNIYNNTSLSLGPENSSSFGFFVAASSQLVLILNGFLQVWRLPSEADKEYELIHVEAFIVISKSHANDICQTKVSSVQSCIHGRKFIIGIKPIRWLPYPKKKDIEDGPEQQEYKEDGYDDDEEEEYPNSDQPQTLTFPRTDEDTFPATEKYRYEKGVASLLDTYADSESGIKDAIIRFLVDRIRPTLRWESSLVILCRSWIYGNRAIFEDVIAKLLPDDDIITWMPDINATKNEDPLSVLLITAKSKPSALEACKIIMDYCVNHAIRHKNLGFLTPFLRNIRIIMALFPDEARLYLRRIAYIPVSERWRDYIVEHNTVTHSPWHCLMQFHKTPLRLEKLKKPIMQLHVTPERPRNKADTFHRPIYAAAFDALWQYKDISGLESANLEVEAVKPASTVKPWTISMPRSTIFTAMLGLTAKQDLAMAGSTVKQESINAQGSTLESKSESAALNQEVTMSTSLDGQMNQRAATPQETMWRRALCQRFRLKSNPPVAPMQVVMGGITMARSPDGLTHHGAAIPQKTNWWKTFYHMFRLKCRLNTHTYVTCHDFSLEFLDNPAIAALVAYKWNTIGFAYWAFRFFFQCVFYVLVFVAALLQVYHENVGRAQLGAVFVAIIVVGAVFLWLELWQATKNFKRYRRDPYNYLDIVAYSLPMAASFIMLMILCDTERQANTRILSYSVLAVFMHMLFELRIYKSVCKYVTIIRQSVLEIRVFFLIFAGGLVAFTVAFLHVLRACPVPGVCEDPETDFSKNFIGALSATYFFMGGRFDPIEKELETQDWAFHAMMAIYFFFTVIVMLNVLIALINKAFTKGDDDWRLDWIESRMHYIELAENLSYHIPGFRQTHDWFPKTIYFCAAALEVENYRDGELKNQLQNLQKHVDQQFKKLETLLVKLDENSKTVPHSITSELSVTPEHNNALARSSTI